MPRHAKIAPIFLALLLLPLQASAQGDLVPEKKLEEKKKSDGWDLLLTPGLSMSLSDNRAVIGQPEGLTMTVGVSIASGANLRRESHEWRNSLNITELFTHTPELEEFVKSTDLVKLESVYLFHLYKWLGPFAKLNLDSVLLEGFDVRPSTVTWTIARADGSTESRTGRHLRLTDGFEPLTLKETAGFFAKPYESDRLNVEGRLGFGGMHVFADGGLAVGDDDTTPEIEVAEWTRFGQAGALVRAPARGRPYDKKLTYRVGAEIMIPFINDLDTEDDRSITELTNIEIGATISFKVFEWLAIDYVFRALRQPQLLDEWQIQNNLLLTASYSFFKPEKEEKK